MLRVVGTSYKIHGDVELYQQQERSKNLLVIIIFFEKKKKIKIKNSEKNKSYILYFHFGLQKNEM